MRYFDYSEFDCRCGNCSVRGEDMDSEFLEMLDEARTYAGVPFKINRGVSCPAHNAAVGGSETSSHLPHKACAADIEADTSMLRFAIIEGLLRAGFRRIGIAPTFIHADSDEEKPAGVAWLY